MHFILKGWGAMLNRGMGVAGADDHSMACYFSLIVASRGAQTDGNRQGRRPLHLVQGRRGGQRAQRQGVAYGFQRQRVHDGRFKIEVNKDAEEKWRLTWTLCMLRELL
jgi:hypothetical protein